MKRHALLALATATAAACGDDGGGTPIDAPEIDAPDVDAEIDAPPATYSGSISYLEAQVLAPGNQGALFGQGPQISASFFSSANVPGPIMEEMPGTPLGCKVWEYNVAQTAAVVAGEDEGVLTITTTAGTAQQMNPPCGYRAGVGYGCPHTGTMSTGGAIAIVTANATASLTDADTTFNDNNSLGRYIRITGAAMAANNGIFPIVARPGANTVVFANPAAVAEPVIPVTGSHINIAGVGPIPNALDPGFIRDDHAVSIALTPGGGNHFAAFTSTTTAPPTVGDDFALVTAETAKLNAVPRTNAPFTVTCAAQGCPGGSASGTVLNIVTTDGTVPASALLFFVMPPPATRRVQIRCAVLQGAGVDGSAVTVPAAYMARLMSNPVTRIQASFIRGTLMGGGPGEVSVVSGHALVGFTTIP